MTPPQGDPHNTYGQVHYLPTAWWTGSTSPPVPVILSLPILHDLLLIFSLIGQPLLLQLPLLFSILQLLRALHFVYAALSCERPQCLRVGALRLWNIEII